MDSVETKEVGMSRAAKKKRRRSSAGKLSQNEDSQSPAVSRKTASKDQSKSPKPKSIDQISDSEFIPGEKQMSGHIAVEKLTIPRILKLKEIEDVTSDQRASLVTSYILNPIKRKDFYTKYWQKLPVHMNRSNDKYFKNVLSKKSFETMLHEQLFIEGVDIDSDPITPILSEEEKSEDEERKEAVINEVWAKFSKGSRIRLLAPQKYHEGLCKLTATLEQEFGAMVGCHATLSPASTNGAEKELDYINPRYECTDSFILQLEGSTIWHLAEPVDEHKLPRFPTYSAAPSDMKNDLEGLNCSKVLLNSGDSMYIPKGWLHQMEVSSEMSLHVRLFTSSTNSIADLLELLLPQALEKSILESSELRKGLPNNFRAFQGVACSENDEDSHRLSFHSKMESLLQSVMTNALGMLDPSADQMAKLFTAQRQPIIASEDEDARTSAGAASATIFPYTRLRMLRPGIAACMVEDGVVTVYHCMDNSRELFGAPLSPLEFELDDGPAIEALLCAYPEGVEVAELPHSSEEVDDKVAVAQALFKEGFLVIEDEASKPAVENEEDEEDDDPF